MEIYVPLIIIIYFLYSFLKRKVKVNRAALVILTVIFSLLSVAGVIIGSVLGMDLGGNYYGDFVFNGLRGYEAVGQIGAIIGGLLGMVCGFLVVLLIIVILIGNGELK